MDEEVYTGHDCRLGLNVPMVCGFLRLGSDGSFTEKPWELTPHSPHRLPPVAVFVENPLGSHKGPFFPFGVQQGLPRAPHPCRLPGLLFLPFSLELLVL